MNASAVDRTSIKTSEPADKIISIAQASEIDEHQHVVTDIYAAVATQNWCFATIPNRHFIRVTFTEILNRTKDLTLYGKATDPQRPVKVTVFPVYGDSVGNQRQGPPLVTTGDGLHPDFHRIGSEARYRVLLCNLPTPTATFDLLIDGGSLDADFIVDPVGWYNPSWLYRKSITIDHTKVGNGSEDQTNFPVLISLSGLTNINANGTDIRFTAGDGTTELPREIESYAVGTLVAWVKVPTLSYTTDTVIYMYFGNAGASEPAANSAYGSQNVWDSNFKGVWHLPNGTTLTANDSTSRANNGTNQGATAITGKIHGGAKFNGSSNYIDLQAISDYSSDVQTLSFWLPNKGTNKIAYILNRSSNADVWGFHGIVYVSGNLYVTENSNGGEQKIMIPYANLNNGDYLSFVYNWPDVTLYLNGTYYNKLTFTNHFTTGSTYKTTIGRAGEYNDYFFDGVVDELRIANTARSLGWIKTEYNNQNSPSTFYTVSAEEDNMLSTPTDAAGHTLNVRPALVWFVPAMTVPANLDFQVTLDGAGSPTADTTTSAVDFEYHNGTAWAAWSGAVASGADGRKVRWRSPTDLTVGAHTWKVCAVAGGTPGPNSVVRNFTIAAIPFGADLTANRSLLAADINQLRTEANLARAFRGLDATIWTETITAKVTHVKKAHLEELRTALTPVFDEAGYIKHGTKPNSIKTDTEENFYSETLTQYVTPIKAIHFQRIRDALGGF